jgi:hypothetical protein
MQTVKTKLPKFVKRITILKSSHEQGAGGGAVVVKRKRKRKKQSKGVIKIMERIARHSARASEATADAYLTRHRRSNRKRRDGWMRDYGYNWVRASRKGAKKFKLSKLLG